ncbi:MAG: kinase [Dokdonella sp.]
MDEAPQSSGYSAAAVGAVADAVVACVRGRQNAWRVGISGLQGSGKSTLARQIQSMLEQRGVITARFSLDDFYLTHAERLRLAREVHPLLATRGVPGTHDFEWLADTLDQLSSASAQWPVMIPRFDKNNDDRAEPNRWQTVTVPPQVILFDGWCVGVTAQTDAALVEPINALERGEDGDGVWRSWVNAVLREHYEPIWRSLDTLIVLQAPSFEVVERWRGEAERARRDKGDARTMSDDELVRFIAHYERISRWSLALVPTHADCLLRLDSGRNVLAVETSKTPSESPQ